MDMDIEQKKENEKNDLKVSLKINDLITKSISKFEIYLFLN